MMLLSLFIFSFRIYIYKFLNALIFMIIFFLLFTVFEHTIKNKTYFYNITSLYDEPKNIDVFFTGSSRIYYPMSTMYI